ncbi:MAG: hypothetical protein SFY68_00650 [Candidatus Sumerlaeia bacterium]|jgi:hypothetical protein|nr:hypothetical protein [Candidatus Sumerlaeia bacterium]
MEHKFIYPWSELEKSLIESDRGSFLLAGIGSLINFKSAARTLSRVPNPPKPIKVLGFIRVYDYIISQNHPELTTRISSVPVAALNVYPSPNHWFNGVLLRVSLDDIEPFRQREVGYDLVPAEYVPYDERSAKPRRVYVLSRPRTPSIFRLMGHHFAPHPHYHELCRAGAASISKPFLRDFYKTTYLADRTTKLEDVLGDCALRPKSALR